MAVKHNEKENYKLLKSQKYKANPVSSFFTVCNVLVNLAYLVQQWLQLFWPQCNTDSIPAI